MSDLAALWVVGLMKRWTELDFSPAKSIGYLPVFDNEADAIEGARTAGGTYAVFRIERLIAPAAPEAEPEAGA